MAVLLTALGSFVCGFVVAWVLLWSSVTSAMSRQSDRNSQHVGELNAQLRTLTEMSGYEAATESAEYEKAS